MKNVEEMHVRRRCGWAAETGHWGRLNCVLHNPCQRFVWCKLPRRSSCRYETSLRHQKAKVKRPPWERGGLPVQKRERRRSRPAHRGPHRKSLSFSGPAPHRRGRPARAEINHTRPPRTVGFYCLCVRSLDYRSPKEQDTSWRHIGSHTLLHSTLHRKCRACYSLYLMALITSTYTASVAAQTSRADLLKVHFVCIF